MVSRIKYMAHQIAQGRLFAKNRKAPGCGAVWAVCPRFFGKNPFFGFAETRSGFAQIDVVQLFQTVSEQLAYFVQLLVLFHNIQIFLAVFFAYAHDNQAGVFL